MAWQQIGNLRGPPGSSGAQGVPGVAGIGEIGPIGPKGDSGAPGQTVAIIGSFSNRTISELPPSGYIPADWDSPGNPPAGNQLANGQGMLYAPTQEVCLWVGPTLTPSGWVELGNVQGPPGPAGAVGQSGSQGEQGVAGIQGEAGPVGPIGPIGIGVKGDKGDTGPVGSTGAKGDKGDPGVAGAVGATGAQGLKGDAGAQGVQGPVGLTGAPGAQGPAGPTAVSANAGNLAKLGTDNLILVPDSAVHAGVTDGSNAAAGKIGEQLSASITTAVNLTSGAAANVGSLALTPGDWSVSGVIVFAEAANTVPTMLAAAVSLASAALPTVAQIASGAGNMTQYAMAFTKGPVSQIMQTGITRVNMSANTTVYLVAQSIFTTAGLSATGYVSARRVR
jgi:hypothetical protein